MDHFYREKSYFTPGKNRENWLCLSEKYSSYAPGLPDWNVKGVNYKDWEDWEA